MTAEAKALDSALHISTNRPPRRNVVTAVATISVCSVGSSSRHVNKTKSAKKNIVYGEKEKGYARREDR